MFVGLFPCNDCAKLIIQSGLKEVVFVSDKYHDKPEMVASRKLLDMAGVKYRCVSGRVPACAYMCVCAYAFHMQLNRTLIIVCQLTKGGSAHHTVQCQWHTI